MSIVRGLIGLAFFVGVAWLMSSHRKKFPTRVVMWGLAMQLVLGWFCIKSTIGIEAVDAMAGFVSTLVSKSETGIKLVFGGLAEGNFSEGGWGFAFAFAASGLPVIIFFSALMAVLYHLGIMQRLVHALAIVMSKLMGVSGAESMAVAANVFVGQTEAPLVVRPFIGKMTASEINALMTGGFATIAGSVLAVYMGLLGKDLAPHLLAASVMSAPAAFLIAKIMLPETEESVTGAGMQVSTDRTAGNLVEAAANGTSDGVTLWLNVVAMLIAFTGLVAVADWILAGLTDNGLWTITEGLTLSKVFGWIFSPVAWLMGIESWNDCQLFGSLLGTKIAINEFIAFDNLRAMVGGGFESTKSSAMAAYALCGFANFASIGIQLGGLSPLAPEKKPLMAKLAVRAMLGGAFASWMTATVAGMFL